MGGEIEQATADAPAPDWAEQGESSAQPNPETIYVINADPRPEPKPLPRFPNPEMRPEGAEPALVLEFISAVPRGIDIAMGRAPKRDTLSFLRAITEAGSRTIECMIDCAGGEAGSALAIATALLQHPYRVRTRIAGRSSSAAIYIALAGDERSIAASGSVLIHQAARICTNEQFEALRLLSAEDKVAINESLNDTDDVTVALLMSRLDVDEVVARGWMKENREWCAAEAFERGFVSEVIS